MVVGNGFLKKDNRDYRRAVELAEQLGVKKSYLSRIENGRADIRLSTLAKILGCMGFDIVAMPRK